MKDIVVKTANGEAEAQQAKAFLRANGIECRFGGEALRVTHGFTLDGLGAVRIVVTEADLERATELLAQVDSGAMTLDSLPVDGD